MSLQRTALLLVTLASLGGAALAGDGKVSGVVTYKGKPVEAGRIIFHLPGGEFVGVKIAADGKYTLRRVPEGGWVVTVEGKGVPEKYAGEATSSVKVNVKTGEQTFDIELR